MILRFTDADGDVVAVEGSAIIAVRVGRVQGQTGLVTLISIPGSTFAVSEPTDDVLAAWTTSRVAPPPEPYPGVIGWLQQYPDGAPTDTSGRRRP
jgi:hypothetical protein